MHWFWRAIIATMVGAAALFAMLVFLEPEVTYLIRWLDRRLPGPSPIGVSLAVGVPVAVVTLAAFGILSLWGGNRPSGETLCRKCGYILRGISEPRCPECGERI